MKDGRRINNYGNEFYRDSIIMLKLCFDKFDENIKHKIHYGECKLFDILNGFNTQNDLFYEELIFLGVEKYILSNKRIINMINYLIMLYSLNNKK